MQQLNCNMIKFRKTQFETIQLRTNIKPWKRSITQSETPLVEITKEERERDKKKRKRMTLTQKLYFSVVWLSAKICVLT